MNLLEATDQRPSAVQNASLSERHKETLHPKKNILLAEDNDDLRFVMELTLTAMGYSVVACADANFASVAFRQQPVIDILLTDFEMPGKTGLELARELSAIRPSMPIMIITGSTLSSEHLQEIYERRWIYMTKPCHLTALESTLKQTLFAELLPAA